MLLLRCELVIAWIVKLQVKQTKVELIAKLYYIVKAGENQRMVFVLRKILAKEEEVLSPMMVKHFLHVLVVAALSVELDNGIIMENVSQILQLLYAIQKLLLIMEIMDMGV